MQTHGIQWEMLTPHGRASAQVLKDALEVRTAYSITSVAATDFRGRLKQHYVALPGAYRLPLRVDMTVRLDFPAFYLLVGRGHVAFASTGQENRKIEDIIKPSGKPNQDRACYDNSLPFGQDVDISVTYNLDEMQIIIGSQERFYSRKQAYMRAKELREPNREGLPIGLAVAKRSTLCVKKISVTELDEQTPVVRGAFEEIQPDPKVGERPKPIFESVIAGLSQADRESILAMDGYLTSLRPLKFKRTVDKSGGKITYVAADFGVSYAFDVSGPQCTHAFNWYIVYNGKPETWHRKADSMEETLAEIAKTDPRLAERIFFALNDCVDCYGPRCLAKTRYAHGGQKRLTCHGRVMLHLCEEDLRDAKEFFYRLNELAARKVANGDPPLEKILLMKSRE